MGTTPRQHTGGMNPAGVRRKPRRRTAIRDRHRAVFARRQAPCGICGAQIDYTLPWYDQNSFVVDHIVPLARGGSDTIDNKQAAHRSCNLSKGSRTDGGKIMRRSRTLAR